MTTTPQDKARQAEQLNWFDFHPATETTGPEHDAVRAKFKSLARFLQKTLPAGPDQTVAIRKLQEAMWASNACIACNQDDGVAVNPASTDSKSSKA